MNGQFGRDQVQEGNSLVVKLADREAPGTTPAPPAVSPQRATVTVFGPVEGNPLVAKLADRKALETIPSGP